MFHLLTTAAEFWYRRAEAFGNWEIRYPQHWRRARILQAMAGTCGWIGRNLDRGPVTDQRTALRILRRATALVRERSVRAGGAAPADAPPMLIVIDEATELLSGWSGKSIRRELSRLAALARSENVTVLARGDGTK
jgi:hypothetical protein